MIPFVSLPRKRGELERENEGRSTNEIEIAPEMIEAGARELASYPHGSESLEEGATRIFRAMMMTRKDRAGGSIEKIAEIISSHFDMSLGSAFDIAIEIRETIKRDR
jgi:hypothetical protein